MCVCVCLHYHSHKCYFDHISPKVWLSTTESSHFVNGVTMSGLILVPHLRLPVLLTFPRDTARGRKARDWLAESQVSQQSFWDSQVMGNGGWLYPDLITLVAARESLKDDVARRWGGLTLPLKKKKQKKKPLNLKCNESKQMCQCYSTNEWCGVSLLRGSIREVWINALKTEKGFRNGSNGSHYYY